MVMSGLSAPHCPRAPETRPPRTATLPTLPSAFQEPGAPSPGRALPQGYSNRQLLCRRGIDLVKGQETGDKHTYSIGITQLVKTFREVLLRSNENERGTGTGEAATSWLENRSFSKEEGPGKQRAGGAEALCVQEMGSSLQGGKCMSSGVFPDARDD